MAIFSLGATVSDTWPRFFKVAYFKVKDGASQISAMPDKYKIYEVLLEKKSLQVRGKFRGI